MAVLIDRPANSVAVADALLARRLRGEPLPLASLLAIPVKDVLIAGVWAVGLNNINSKAEGTLSAYRWNGTKCGSH